ncbi:uncharacterized protein LOC144487466 [Mustelus asterias]
MVLDSSIDSSDAPRRKTAPTSSEDKHGTRWTEYPSSSSTSPERRSYDISSGAFNMSLMKTNISPRPSPHPHFLPSNNLKQTIVRSKLPSLQENSDHDTTQPCHSNLCKTCRIIETDAIISRENTIHQVHGTYSCNSANVVYLIRCRKGCPEAWYIGETMQTLRQRMNEHRSTITRQDCSLPVGEHFSGHGHSASDLRLAWTCRVSLAVLSGDNTHLFNLS